MFVIDFFLMLKKLLFDYDYNQMKKYFFFKSTFFKFFLKISFSLEFIILCVLFISNFSLVKNIIAPFRLFNLAFFKVNIFNNHNFIQIFT